MGNLFEMECILRLVLATAAGILIGYERHNRAKEAGIRTHAMVAMGACLLMIISKYGFRDIGTGDPARVAAQVVSGVGFLGAGVIFVRHDLVQGLTTAAGIWTISAVGLCFGSGMYVIALTGMALLFLIQNIFRLFIPHNYLNVSMRIRIRLRKEATVRDVAELIHRCHFHQTGENKFTSDGEDGYYLSCEVATNRASNPQELLAELEKSDKIISAELI